MEEVKNLIVFGGFKSVQAIERYVNKHGGNIAFMEFSQGGRKIFFYRTDAYYWELDVDEEDMRDLDKRMKEYADEIGFIPDELGNSPIVALYDTELRHYIKFPDGFTPLEPGKYDSFYPLEIDTVAAFKDASNDFTGIENEWLDLVDAYAIRLTLDLHTPVRRTLKLTWKSGKSPDKYPDALLLDPIEQIYARRSGIMIQTYFGFTYDCNRVFIKDYNDKWMTLSIPGMDG